MQRWYHIHLAIKQSKQRDLQCCDTGEKPLQATLVQLLDNALNPAYHLILTVNKFNPPSTKLYTHLQQNCSTAVPYLQKEYFSLLWYPSWVTYTLFLWCANVKSLFTPAIA